MLSLMFPFLLQYNPPSSAAEYVHRVGRTARIGAQGNGLLFLTPSETAYIDVLAGHNIRSVDQLLQTQTCPVLVLESSSTSHFNVFLA